MAPVAYDVEGALLAGQEALGAGDWSTARAAFEEVLEQGEVAEALIGLGDALWWLGDTEPSLRSTERAFAVFMRNEDPGSAAFAAIGLYFVYRVSLGNVAASRGWLARAASLVDTFGMEPLEGWVVLIRAHDAGDPRTSEGWAREALDLARRTGDPDLHLCALSQLGAALVGQGRVSEGVVMLDEAMAASLAGECARLDTVVYTSCSMITACSQVAEIERAAQWIRAADDFTRRYGCPHLFTVCRTEYGGLLFARGQWAEAEQELLAALKIGASAERAVYGEALARLAELRVAQGRVEEAARLVVGFEDDAAMGAVTAALHLAGGRPGAAATVLRRHLRIVDQELEDARLVAEYGIGAPFIMEHARLRELLVEAEVARSDLAAAEREAARLAELAAGIGWEVVVARADRARGRLEAARGEGEAAAACFDRAVAAFARLSMPLEAGRARLLLAAVLAGADRESAVVEARAALAAFERLSAAHDADQAAALLRGLGERAARAGPRGAGALTRRETEVLRLLGQGLSNRQIADRLYLTVKTVEHHVRGVFVKLDLANRAEAAAYAVRHLERGSTPN
jgi:DNA-binding CsgD family transcriptional regulator